MTRISAWLLFVSGRFGSVDRKGRSAVTNLLSALGIAFGTTALIVILAVMNGFQQGYIKSILETSSYHVRVPAPGSRAAEVEKLAGVLAAVPFRDIQTLILGNYGRQSGCLLRALPENVAERDPGFAAEARIVSGRFDLAGDRSIVLGNELSKILGAKVGDTVSLVAVAGGADADMFPINAVFDVKGIFKTGYAPIDIGYAFVSEAVGRDLAGGKEPDLVGVKLKDTERDDVFLRELAASMPGALGESWRTFNRAFFGALKIEKNMMMFLVILIFVVVAVNIYHGMRRAVFERREEIAILSALGASGREIRFLFILNGLGTGFAGSLLGLAAGLFVSVHINGVFALAESAVNFANLFIASLTGLPAGEQFSLFNPRYFYMELIPVRIFLSEAAAVFSFGILSAAGAAWYASRNVLRLKPAEVLRYE